VTLVELVADAASPYFHFAIFVFFAFFVSFGVQFFSSSQTLARGRKAQK